MIFGEASLRSIGPSARRGRGLRRPAISRPPRPLDERAPHPMVDPRVKNAPPRRPSHQDRAPPRRRGRLRRARPLRGQGRAHHRAGRRLQGRVLPALREQGRLLAPDHRGLRRQARQLRRPPPRGAGQGPEPTRSSCASTGTATTSKSSNFAGKTGPSSRCSWEAEGASPMPTSSTSSPSGWRRTSRGGCRDGSPRRPLSGRPRHHVVGALDRWGLRPPGARADRRSRSVPTSRPGARQALELFTRGLLTKEAARR
jgi:hypothetical protein